MADADSHQEWSFVMSGFRKQCPHRKFMKVPIILFINTGDTHTYTMYRHLTLTYTDTKKPIYIYKGSPNIQTLQLERNWERRLSIKRGIYG